MDNLDNTSGTSVGEETLVTLPSHLVAASNHNLAANEDPGTAGFLTDIAKGAAGAVAGGTAGAVLGPMGAVAGAVIGGVTGYAGTDFTVAAALSGAATFANTATAWGNMLPGEEKQLADVHDWMAAYDDNLPAYYDAHKDAVDMAGEVAGMMIPGTVGVKAYNMAAHALLAGRAGIIGVNMEGATGLLGGTQKVLLDMAAKNAKTSTDAFSYLNKAFVGSVLAGAGEQALQGAVFGTAAAATMFKSPLMEGQDVGDIATNIMHMAAFGGGLGGLVEGAVAKNFISKTLDKKAADLMHITHINEVQGGDSWQRIMGYADSYDTIKAADLVPLAEYGQIPAQLKDKNLRKIEDLIRGEFQSMAGGNAINKLFGDTVMLGDNFRDIGNTVMGMKTLTRVNEVTASERELAKFQDRLNKTDPINPTAKFPAITAEEFDILDSHKVAHFKLWGEGRGQYGDRPDTLDLASTLKGKEAISVTTSGVTAGPNKWKFNGRDNFDISTMDIHQAEAYHLFLNAHPSLAKDATIAYYDVHRIGKVIKDLAAMNADPAKVTGYKFITREGAELTGLTRNDINKFQEESLRSVTQDLLYDGKKSDEIALMTNQKVSVIEGTRVTNQSDFFAKETAVSDYLTAHEAKTTNKGKISDLGSSAQTLILQPQYAKAIYDSKVLADLDQFQIEGMAYIKQREVLWKQEADNTYQQVVPQKYIDQMPATGDQEIRQVTAKGTGMKLFAFANGAYGTIDATVQRIGKLANTWKTEAAKSMEDTFAPHFNAIVNAGTEAVVELSSIEKAIRGTGEKYVFDDAGEHLVLKSTKDYLDAIAAGKTVKEPIRNSASAPEYIQLESDEVRKFLQSHIEVNGVRNSKRGQILQTLQGKIEVRDPNVLYLPPKNPKDYPFVAFVTDSTVSGTGHMSMIHATDASKLQQMIDKVPIGNGLTVHTKGEAERWHKLMGDYSRQETMGDNYIDAAMSRSGVGSEYMPHTDSKKLLGDILNWHKDEEAALIREAIGLKHSKFISELKHMDSNYSDVLNSKIGNASLFKFAAESTSSPYMSYIRTMMDIPNLGAVPGRAIQGWLDSNVTKVWNELASATTKTTSVEGLDQINSAMDKFVIKPFDYDVATQALANHSPDSGALSTFVRRSQSLLAGVTLGLDSLTGITNTVGSTILMGSELKSIFEAAKNSPELVGKLNEVINVVIPGTSHAMLSPAKLMGNAIKASMTTEGVQFVKDLGFDVRHLEEVMLAYDNAALPSVYTSADLNSKLTSNYKYVMKLLDKGSEKIFKTKQMESFQRAVAVHSMKQLTDLAEGAGLMGRAEADTYINTFVNRVQGNYLASQRPGMFHGTIGQSVGLFQTYNINLLQQLFRHVGAGDKKSAALMMGLQAGIFGANGLPAFQAINTHLVGNAAGNSSHNDIYKTVYNNTDKNTADWLMYGALSNVGGLFHPDLKTNLYTRGDINPRHLSIVPTSFEALPIVSVSAKFFGNLLDTGNKMLAGADVGTTLLRGLEHNAISRPLSGLAVGLEALTNPSRLAYSTSNSGNLVSANDVFSIATLSRMAGAKPLGDALTSDEAARSVVYRATDKTRIAALGEVLKTKVAGGQHLNGTEVIDTLHKYLKSGGKQEGFNAYMMGVYKSANTAQANTIARKLKSPEANTMQHMMGGRFKDFGSVGTESEGASETSGESNEE